MKFAIHQFNPTVGAINENITRLIAAINVAINQRCDIFVSSELAVCGYLPKDLLLRPEFHKQIKIGLERFLECLGITILIPAPYMEEGLCYNSVFIIRDGQIIDRYDKQKLPNYEVFDEYRYFATRTTPVIFEQNGIKLGVIICEDTWYKEPGMLAKQAGAEILISVNASPFSMGKYHQERLDMARTRASEINIPLIYVNQLGGQDNLVFDGASFIMGADGNLLAQFPAFEQELNYFVFPDIANAQQSFTPYPDDIESAYKALVLATYDYVTKNGFNGVLLGLSGGVDSALTLAIAVDALGADKVMAVMMPSAYTADISIIDARDMAKELKVAYEEISINSIFSQFTAQLAPVFNKPEIQQLAGENITVGEGDIVSENLQARTRGVLLMALSNKLGYLVLSTGNKSEMATGYATLYGDMAGGFAVLKDVPKTLVYKLSNWRNAQSRVIPERIITRPPSAELRPEQSDQDSLPDYATLDAILDLVMEDRLSSSEIIARGFNAVDVLQVVKLVKLNEYKRSQAAIGPKITKCAFNNDWRYPITNSFQF